MAADIGLSLLSRLPFTCNFSLCDTLLVLGVHLCHLFMDTHATEVADSSDLLRILDDLLDSNKVLSKPYFIFWLRFSVSFSSHKICLANA